MIVTDEGSQSRTSTASGLVTGVGKGLVGIFTKPIGGAAEFVSQTGQGARVCNLIFPTCFFHEDLGVGFYFSKQDEIKCFICNIMYRVYIRFFI